jgi:hypothetical protein
MEIATVMSTDTNDVAMSRKDVSDISLIPALMIQRVHCEIKIQSTRRSAGVIVQNRPRRREMEPLKTAVAASSAPKNRRSLLATFPHLRNTIEQEIKFQVLILFNRLLGTDPFSLFSNDVAFPPRSR